MEADSSPDCKGVSGMYVLCVKNLDFNVVLFVIFNKKIIYIIRNVWKCRLDPHLWHLRKKK